MVWERVFSAGVIRGIFLVPLCSDATEMLTPSFLNLRQKKKVDNRILVTIITNQNKYSRLNPLGGAAQDFSSQCSSVRNKMKELRLKGWGRWRVSWLPRHRVCLTWTIALFKFAGCPWWFFVFFGIFLPFIMAPRHKLDSSHFQNETDFNRVVGLNGVVNFKAALVTICCRCWKKTHRLIQIWLQFHFPC